MREIVIFEKYLETCDDWGKRYYGSEIKKLSDEQKAQLLDLIKKMEECGCTDPISYAFSEVKEGIPQFARYLVLRQLFQIADDVEGVCSSAVDYCDCSEQITYVDFKEMHEQMKRIVGIEKLNKYLKVCNRGMISDFISLLDSGVYIEEGEGVYDSDIGFSWALVMTDICGNVLGDKTIGGLHEDFYDFKK